MSETYLGRASELANRFYFAANRLIPEKTSRQLAVGLAALAFTGAPLAYDIIDKTGEVTLKCPDRDEIPDQAPGLSGFGTFNVAGKFLDKQIRNLMDENDLMAIGIQEVPVSDIPKYYRSFKDMCVISIVADPKDLPKRGQANIIISKVRPDSVDGMVLDRQGFWGMASQATFGAIEDIRAWVVNGNGNFVYGGAKNSEIKELSWSALLPRLNNTEKAIKENRAILSAVFKYRYEGQLQTARFTTGHASFIKADQPRQQHKIRDFLRRNRANTQVAGLDWNADTEPIQELMIEDGYITPSTDSTTDTNRTIDHFSYRANLLQHAAYVKVIKESNSDHDPVILQFYTYTYG